MESAAFRYFIFVELESIGSEKVANYYILLYLFRICFNRFLLHPTFSMFAYCSIDHSATKKYDRVMFSWYMYIFFYLVDQRIILLFATSFVLFIFVKMVVLVNRFFVYFFIIHNINMKYKSNIWKYVMHTLRNLLRFYIKLSDPSFLTFTWQNSNFNLVFFKVLETTGSLL